MYYCIFYIYVEIENVSLNDTHAKKESRKNIISNKEYEPLCHKMTQM